MDMQPPPAFVQVAQAEVPPDAPVELTPIEVNVSKYIPESAISVTMIETLTPPTGQAVIYAAGNERSGTLFEGPTLDRRSQARRSNDIYVESSMAQRASISSTPTIGSAKR